MMTRRRRNGVDHNKLKAIHAEVELTTYSWLADLAQEAGGIGRALDELHLRLQQLAERQAQ